MKWSAIAAVTGSTAVVSNGEGQTGIVAVRWTRNQPQLFGPVYSNRYDNSGNQVVDNEGLPITDVIDNNPEL